MFDKQIEIATAHFKIEIYKGPEQFWPKSQIRIKNPTGDVIMDGYIEDEGGCFYKYITKGIRKLADTPVPLTTEEAQALAKKDYDPAYAATGNASKTIMLNLSHVVAFNDKQMALALALKDYGVHTIKLKYIVEKKQGKDEIT